MRNSIPARTASTNGFDGKAELKRRRPSLRDSKSAIESSKLTVQAELARLLTAEETHMEADNLGMEQLIAALTRIPIPRRRNKTPKSE